MVYISLHRTGVQLEKFSGREGERERENRERKRDRERQRERERGGERKVGREFVHKA